MDLRNRVIAAGAIVLALALLPVLFAPHLLLLDAPAHEARIAILRDLLLHERASPFYYLESFFLPNIAFDIIGFLLGFFAAPEEVGRLFFGLTLILTVSGIASLNRLVTGRWGLVPLASGLFLYNLIAILGFFSYALGLALVPWAMAVRISFKQASLPLRFLAGAASAVLLLFCHVFALGIYAIMSAGFTFHGLREKQIGWRLALAQLLELVPAALLLLSMPTGRDSRLRYEADYLLTKALEVAKSLSSGSLAGDIALLAGTGLLVLLVMRSSRRRIVPSFVPGLVGLAALFLILPQHFATGSYVDLRIPIAIIFMLLSGLDVQVSERKEATVLTALIGAALAVKQIAIAVLWRSLSFGTEDFIREMSSLPEPAIILQSECQPQSGLLSTYRQHQPSLQNISAMAAFGDSRFVAKVYAIRGQQPIRALAPYLDFYRLQLGFELTCGRNEYLEQFNQLNELVAYEISARHSIPPVYFLMIRPPSPDPLGQESALIRSGANYALYKVDTGSR